MTNVLDLNATKDLLNKSSCYYIICTDTDGNYSYVNERYANKFKFISHELVGQPYYITMHPDDRKICEEVGARCYTNPGKMFPAVIRKHNGKGGYIVTQWEFTLAVDNGVTTGIFCLGYDITDYARIKDEVSAISAALTFKEKVLQDIAFEQSHIVRAPLANIMGLVGILKNLDLGPNASSVVKMLEESSEQLDDVIKGIINKVYK